MGWWIESHQALKDHPKTRRLARTLGVSIPTAVGHLHLLWWWALDYAPDGKLGPYDAGDLAEAAMWDGDAGAFKEALLHCGPGDRHGFLCLSEGVLELHDWDDFTGKLQEKRAGDAERKRKDRERKRAERERARLERRAEEAADIPGTSSGRPADVRSNPTEPEPEPEPDGAPPSGDGGAPPDKKAKKPRRAACPFKAIQDLWNQIAVPFGYPAVQELTEERKRRIRPMWEAHPDLAWFEGLFRRATTGDHMKRFLGFDALMRRGGTTAAKLLEGAYDEAFQRKRETRTDTPSPDTRSRRYDQVRRNQETVQGGGGDQ